eukprot:6208233-Pleurochrysis_carterae.AAC.3
MPQSRARMLSSACNRCCQKIATCNRRMQSPHTIACHRVCTICFRLWTAWGGRGDDAAHDWARAVGGRARQGTYLRDWARAVGGRARPGRYPRDWARAVGGRARLGRYPGDWARAVGGRARPVRYPHSTCSL